MKEEYAVDFESQKTLLYAINASLKRKNQKLVTQLESAPKTKHRRGQLNNGLVMLIIAAIPAVFFVSYDLGLFPESENSEFRTNYTIQNLQGDKVDTWTHWNLMGSERIAVNIVNAGSVSDDKIEAIKNAILSEKAVQIEDYLLHKAPKGSSSTYYEGWRGALLGASKNSTTFPIPSDFVIIESPRGEGQITIHLLSEKSGDGYSGYTKSTTEKGQILKSSITIYDVDSISADQMGTIMRHEFGHALGLGHSSAPEDLMAPIITTAYPYVSECDVDAISALYDGRTSSEVTCKK